MTTDERIDKLAAAMDARFNRVDDYFLQFRSEVTRRLDAIDQRLELLGSSVVSMDSRLPALNKAVLDFGSLAGQLTRERSRDLTADWYDRLVRLEEKVSRLVEPAA